MKRVRLMSLLLSWACFICLCSVGFSSWYQFDPSNFEAHGKGSFIGYDTVDMDECVYAEAGSFQIFEYSSLSFVESTSGGTVETDVGTISVVYVVDLAKAKAAMTAAGKTWSGTLNVKICLSYENLADYGEGDFRGLFLPLNNAPANSQKTVAVTVDSVAPTGAVSNSGTEISFTQTLTGLGDTGTRVMNVVYSFNVPKSYTDDTVGNFRNHFGKYLKTDGAADGKATQFITTARIVELLA